MVPRETYFITINQPRFRHVCFMGTLFPQLAPPLRILNKKQKTVDFSRDVMYIIVDMKKREKLLLMAVFWDLPKFRDEDYLRGFLEEQKGKIPYQWAMTRFLEHGRVIDTFALFNIKEISEYLPSLKLSPHALKKWKRMLEVYA